MSGTQVTIIQAKIKGRAGPKTSIMPEGLLRNVSLRDAVDLRIFLEQGLKK